MKLRSDEEAMLAGKEGLARQKAMELLVEFGDGLGADRFVNTNNVTIITGLFPFPDLIKQMVPSLDPDEIASKFYLNSDETVIVDKVKAFTTSHVFRNRRYPQYQQGHEFLLEVSAKMEEYCKRIGVANIATCSPYQSGNVPVMGEHCAWTESSAIPFCNAVLGGRTNVEGLHSAFASALTGKTPFWGLHLEENRKGKVIIDVNVDMTDILEWNLLGYYVGSQVGLDIPIYRNIATAVDMIRLMSLCAAGASSGGVSMFHIVGHTPEAPSIDEVKTLSKKLPTIVYGERERRLTYEKLNRATSKDVDIVALGCPHYTLERMQKLAGLLEGKKIHPNVDLFVVTCRMNKIVADLDGVTEIITKAGGKVMEDTCGIFFDYGTSRTIASDSAKLIHYVPMTADLNSTLLGTMEQCVEAALTGKWKG